MGRAGPAASLTLAGHIASSIRTGQAALAGLVVLPGLEVPVAPVPLWPPAGPGRLFDLAVRANMRRANKRRRA